MNLTTNNNKVNGEKKRRKDNSSSEDESEKSRKKLSPSSHPYRTEPKRVSTNPKMASKPGSPLALLKKTPDYRLSVSNSNNFDKLEEHRRSNSLGNEKSTLSPLSSPEAPSKNNNRRNISPVRDMDSESPVQSSPEKTLSNHSTDGTNNPKSPKLLRNREQVSPMKTIPSTTTKAERRRQKSEGQAARRLKANPSSPRTKTRSTGKTTKLISKTLEDETVKNYPPKEPTTETSPKTTPDIAIITLSDDIPKTPAV